MTRHCRGFTLIELVVSITLSTIVVSFMAVFISTPVAGYADMTRRAQLVDLAENSLRRISRDVRRSLPNSIRTRISGTVTALEMLNTVDGARYRDSPPPGDATKYLDFSIADDAFNSVGVFRNLTLPFTSTTHYLSIYNVGNPGADAYELVNVITPAGTQIDIITDTVPNENNIQLTPAFEFEFASPNQRVFLLDGPISYLCDTAAGTMTRYVGYAIDSSHANRDSHAELITAGATSTLIANRLNTCTMTYAQGASQRAGLITLALSVSDTNESISLLHQVHVDNVP